MTILFRKIRFFYEPDIVITVVTVVIVVTVDGGDMRDYPDSSSKMFFLPWTILAKHQYWAQVRSVIWNKFGRARRCHDLRTGYLDIGFVARYFLKCLLIIITF